VEGSCLEPTLEGLGELGSIALGTPAGGAVVESSSFVLHATDNPSRPFELATASGFTDLDLAVERGATAGEWRLYAATMESPEISRGLPVLLDVALRDVVADTVARAVAAGSDATSVAAEAIGDGRPAFLWVVGTPDPIDSPDSPLTFAFFQRAEEGTNVMRTDDEVTRFPAEAAIATGLGADGLGPSWGIRVASPTESYFMAVAPSGGRGSQAILDLAPGDRMPVWIRRQTPAASKPKQDASIVVRVSGDAG
jgi:hypothetical protein